LQRYDLTQAVLRPAQRGEPSVASRALIKAGYRQVLVLTGGKDALTTFGGERTHVM